MIDPRIQANLTRRTWQRGGAMVSVMLLTISMLTVAALIVRSSSRRATQASAWMAREKAMMAAHSAVDLAAAQFRRQIVGLEGNEDDEILSDALRGYNAPPNANVCQRDLSGDRPPDYDCIPGSGDDSPTTGQRNHVLGGNSDCAGRPCMRPGAVVRLPAADFEPRDWSEIPLAELVQGGDPEARVSVWVRNNTSEAIGGGTGSWVSDSDNRIVITAMATVRHTTVAIEQEFLIKPPSTAVPLVPPTPDEGYGGGHNGDNTAVIVCNDLKL